MKKLMTIAVTAFMSLTSTAQQENLNVSENGEKVNVPESIQILNAAGILVQYGYAQESALPLIQAVEIYQNLVAEGTRSGVKTSESDESAIEESKQNNISFEIDVLLKDATKFADGDEHLIALIDELKNNSTRGATKNYETHYDRVNAKSTDTYTIRFRGNETACVIVSGDGDTDLDLYIYDENGNLVESDTDSLDQCVCSWVPKWTGSFKIKIKNLGKVYNRYALIIN